MGIVVSVVASLGAVVLVLLAVAALSAGLFYAAEFAETNTVMTRKFITLSAKIVLGVHVCLLFDGPPLFTTLVSAAAHVVYFSLLAEFPFVQIVSPKTLGSAVMFVVAHVFWFKYFLAQPVMSVVEVMGFFLVCVWIVPLSLFVSLSINDNLLPSEAHASRTVDATGRSKRASIFHTVYNAASARLCPRRAAAAAQHKMYNE